MSNLQIISTKSEYIRLLLFLYPTYFYTEYANVNKDFIVRRDIKSKAEKDLLCYRCESGIVVSNVVFDELWDENKLKEKALQFAHDRFGSRKKVLDIGKMEGNELVDYLIKFMFFGNFGDEEDSSITELFDAFGSARFFEKFLQLSERHPVQQLIASMMTFISKIFSSESIFYKKKNILFAGKIKKRFVYAYDSYMQRENDIYGLSFLKFIEDLTIS